MLSDEQLREAFDSPSLTGGLRAVEAAVRADQIEKDAAIAMDRHRKVQDEPFLIAWRIRQQLPTDVRTKPYLSAAIVSEPSTPEQPEGENRG